MRRAIARSSTSRPGEPLLPGRVDRREACRRRARATERSPSSCASARTAARSKCAGSRPTAEGAPVHAVFTVSPEPDVPTVYTVQIPRSRGRSRRREQQPQRARAAADRQAAAARRRRRARVTSTRFSKRARCRTIPASRSTRGPQGPERRWAGYVLRAGRSVADGGAVERLSVQAVGAVRV